jgi:membrane-associated protease RseP (regulator of RpoE activity)
MDNNLVHREGATEPRPATNLAEQSKRDEHSIVADAQFVAPANGDFSVKEGSPALKLGFVNFPMDRFGVQKPELKAIARTPEMPRIGNSGRPARKDPSVQRVSYAFQSQIRDISGLGDRSAYGLPDESGVLLLDVTAGSAAAKAGLRKDDVVRTCNGQPVRTVADLQKLRDKAAGRKLTILIIRKQNQATVEVRDYAYVVSESSGFPDFKMLPLVQASAVLPAKVSAGGAPTNNDPIESLTDGKVVNSYGPVFANGVECGMYKVDLAAVKSIAQVNTFSSLGGRSRQNFVLYGSNAATDPGWKVADATVFAPIISVDTRQGASADFAATSIRHSDGKPLGSHRWLVWAVSPVTDDNQENTAFQELQVIPWKGGKK